MSKGRVEEAWRWRPGSIGGRRCSSLLFSGQCHVVVFGLLCGERT